MKIGARHEKAHACTHTHVPIKFLLASKAKKGGGNGSFDPKTEQSFSQYVMHMRI